MIKDSMFDGYAVTNDGKVYSKKTNKFIKPSIGSKGYFQVCLTVDGKKRTVKVHRIVAETFIPNPEGKPQVNHIDGNKRNNCVENLEWCTNSENQIHSYRVIGNENHGGDGWKTPVICVEMNKTYCSARAAARDTGVCVSNIIKACQKKRKTAGGCHWNYGKGGREKRRKK